MQEEMARRPKGIYKAYVIYPFSIKISQRWHKFTATDTYMLFTGWEVRIGRNCARGLEYRPRSQAEGGTQTEGTVSHNTDRPRPVNNIFVFFLLRYKSFLGKLYFSLQPMCVEEGRVPVDVIQSARSITNQNKTLQYDF